ncbi:uncharacterized protein [Halyomorpha halys]|uniref:uncharacterized protein n=1 Tax=Halyomorpha halys TaxID=286706 RepID=UPI0006D4D366|nr:uncharacterized protein LOC106679312 [Halyomorpha halys]
MMKIMDNPFLQTKKFLDSQERDGISQDLSTIIREPRLDMEKQLDSLLSTMKTANRDILVEEMSEVLKLITNKVEELEIESEKRYRKMVQHQTGDFNKFYQNEENFINDVELCKKIFHHFLKSFGIYWPNPKLKKILHSHDLYKRIDRFAIYTKGKHYSEKQKELIFCLEQIMIRFAGLCESEKIKHNLPVPIAEKTGYNTPPELPPPSSAITGIKPNKAEHIIRSITLKSESQNEKLFSKENEQNFEPIVNYQTSTIDDEELCKSNVQKPTGFIEVYCKLNGKQPQYNDLGVLKKAWNSEHIYTCKVLKYAGEGRGKKRIIAKQRAAANLIKTIITRQKRGKLAPELKPLNLEQQELAIMLMSEYLPFDEDLDLLSQEESQRAPIYTPLINTPGNHIRCKALGLNAVGYGKNKDIAKRMSAKLILDKYQDIKEQKKKEQKLKIASKSDNAIDK